MGVHETLPETPTLPSSSCTIFLLLLKFNSTLFGATLRIFRSLPSCRISISNRFGSGSRIGLRFFEELNHIWNLVIDQIQDFWNVVIQVSGINFIMIDIIAEVTRWCNYISQDEKEKGFVNFHFICINITMQWLHWMCNCLPNFYLLQMKGNLFGFQTFNY